MLERPSRLKFNRSMTQAVSFSDWVDTSSTGFSVWRMSWRFAAPRLYLALAIVFFAWMFDRSRERGLGRLDWTVVSPIECREIPGRAHSPREPGPAPSRRRSFPAG